MDGEVMIRTVDYWWYSLYMLYYRFVDYPLMIKVCAVVVTLCVLIYIFLALKLIIGNYVEQRRVRRRRKMEKKYGEEVDRLMASPITYTVEEMADRLNWKVKPEKKIKRKISEALVAMFWIKGQQVVQTKGANDYTYLGEPFNKENYYNLLTLFRITPYLEKKVEGVRLGRWGKLKTFRTILFLHAPINKGICLRHIFDKNSYLSKETLHLYSWLTDGEPYRAFEESINRNFQWNDRVEMFHRMNMRDLQQKPILDFCLWLNMKDMKSHLRVFCVEAIGKFNQREHCGFLYDLLRTCEEDNELKCSLIKTLGHLQYSKAEDYLMQLYRGEDADVRKRIISALVDMKTGHHRVVEFLKARYERTRDVPSMLHVLNSLYHYSDEGRTIFYRLKATADERYQLCFKHIESDLANDKSYAL